MELLKERVKAYAYTIGIDKIGFTHAGPFEEERVHMLNQRNKGWSTDFEESDIEKRVNPKYSLEDVASIIAIAVAYPSRLTIERPHQEELSGQFCASSWGQDYHVVLQEKLQLLQSFLEENIPNVHVKIMVDTGALSDRAVAKRAGLGFIGKNGALITEEYGSFVYLGEMLTNIPFPPDIPLQFSECGSCEKCIRACPAQAIKGHAQIDGQKCLSYVTQKKTILSDAEKSKLGRRIYGCDTCQEVCPKNQVLSAHQYEVAFKPELELVFPKLTALFSLSNREFKHKYGHMAGAWRGKLPIQRNAIIIAGNRKDLTSYPLILKLFQTDPRATIRESACWALGKYMEIEGYQTEIIDILTNRLHAEEDSEVKKAIEKVLGEQQTS